MIEYGHYGFQVFLFFVYFFIGYYFFFPTTSTISTEVEVKEIDKSFMSSVKSAFEVEPEPLEEIEEEGKEVKQYPSFQVLINGFGKAKMTQAMARKAAGRLGIQQKVNGKDLNSTMLVGKVRQRYEKEPRKVLPVLEALYGQKVVFNQEAIEKNSAA